MLRATGRELQTRLEQLKGERDDEGPCAGRCMVGGWVAFGVIRERTVTSLPLRAAERGATELHVRLKQRQGARHTASRHGAANRQPHTGQREPNVERVRLCHVSGQGVALHRGCVGDVLATWRAALSLDAFDVHGDLALTS